MIRILHIVSSLNINSGVATWIMNYYRNIDRSEVQFDFLYLYELKDSYVKEVTSLGGHCYKVPEPFCSKEGIKYIRNFFHERSDEYDAVHCHPIFTPIVFGYFAKKNGIKHIIAHSHDQKYSEKRISSIRNRLLMLFAPAIVTEYIACSKAAASLFPRNKDVTILHNAIDAARYKFNNKSRESVRHNLGIKEDAIVIGHVGRFAIQKNHELIIDIFSEYCKNHNAYLVLIGGGELRTKIEAKVEQLGLKERVLFLGKRSDIPDLLCAMDYFLFPSLHEGFGIALLEAQASGVTSLASDCIPKEVFITDNINAIPVNDKEKWINTLEKLNPTSLDQRESYVDVINKKGYEIKSESDILLKFYKEL